MKRIITILTLFISCTLAAQSHVMWTTSLQGSSLRVNGKIDKGWRLYATNKSIDVDGPGLEWGDPSLDSVKVNVMTPAAKGTDKVFGTTVFYYENSVELSQQVPVMPGNLRVTIKG